MRERAPGVYPRVVAFLPADGRGRHAIIDRVSRQPYRGIAHELAAHGVEHRLRGHRREPTIVCEPGEDLAAAITDLEAGIRETAPQSPRREIRLAGEQDLGHAAPND